MHSLLARGPSAFHKGLLGPTLTLGDLSGQTKAPWPVTVPYSQAAYIGHFLKPLSFQMAPGEPETHLSGYEHLFLFKDPSSVPSTHESNHS